MSASPVRPYSGVAVDLAELIALREEARRLDLTPRGKALATRAGGHLSPFRGRGMEFDESRAYQPGDDVRNMDWRVTARAGRPHVKLFREERERPVWLAVDQGPALRFGTRVAFKSVIAARVAALLAWAAAERGDRVGGLVFDETRRFESRPAGRARGVLPLLKALADGSVGAGAGGFPSLTPAAEHLVRQVRPGSLVVWISDFAGIGPDDGAWMARLGGSELVLIHLFDPLEVAAPPPGLYPVSDGPIRRLLDTGQASGREAWTRRFEGHLARLREVCQRHRAHLISLRSDQPLGDALVRGLTPLRSRKRSGQ